MALIHTEGDPLVVLNPDTGSVLVTLNATDGLRFRSEEHYSRWVEALDRGALNAFAPFSMREAG